MYLSAFRAVVRGPDPDGADNAAPYMEDWTPVLRGEHLYLAGQVTGHPRLGDTYVFTSGLVYVTEDQQWARTLSRWYRPGAPLAVDTSAAFPDVVLAATASRWTTMRSPCRFLSPDGSPKSARS